MLQPDRTYRSVSSGEDTSCQSRPSHSLCLKPDSFSGEEEILDSEFVHEELENAVRAVLMNLDNLHPFTTQYFHIFPYKSKWERVSELRFRKGDKKLLAYPYLITLYVEANELTVNHANKRVPSDRESRSDSPQLPATCALLPANEPKRRRTEEPQGGRLSSDHRYDKPDAHLRLLESPYRSEELACGHEVYADLQESSPHPTSPEFTTPHEPIVEQDAPDSKSTEREKPGVFARLASIAFFFSIAAFPISLLFKRS